MFEILKIQKQKISTQNGYAYDTLHSNCPYAINTGYNKEERLLTRTRENITNETYF